MKTLICFVFIIAMAGCATCKSSDTVEQCRTKQRDKSQKSSSLVPISTLDRRLAGAFVAPTLEKAQ